MIDIAVKDLVKSFEVGKNILDAISFEINAGERVGIMGRNGAGKTTLFRILTGEIDFDTGEVSIASGKKLGLISQIPRYPERYTVEDVLRSAFQGLMKLKRDMEALETQMQTSATKEILSQYDTLCNRYSVGGGYEMDVQTDKICNGLAISAQMRSRLF